ncbi:hypothetical protein D3C85_737110 [compost metagenome]
MNALLAGLAFADVAEKAHVTGKVTFVVEYGGDADPGRVMLATAAFEPDFAFPGAVLMQLLEHIAQVGFLLVVDGQHVRQLVEHLRHLVATDAAERFVGLHDVAGRIGDQNGRGRVLEYGGRHAQVFLGAALLADITTDPQHTLEGAVFVPHQDQPQLDRDLASVGAQGVEQEQLGLHLVAQLCQLLRFVQGLADPVHQAVDAGQLLRVGDDRLPAVLEYPVSVIAEYSLYGRADIVERECVVGGENDVADAFGKHPIALLAVAQGFAGGDLVGDVLGHADDASNLIVGVPCQRLLANIEAAPLAVAVTEAQQALQQLAVPGLALFLAQAVVVIRVFGVQQDFPEVLTHLVQFGFVVPQGLPQVVVAEDHALADHILHIQVIRDSAHHIGPEAFTLQQREFDELAAGDVVDAEDDRVVVVLCFRQAQDQPQVLIAALGVLELDFQFQLFLLVDHRLQQRSADGIASQWPAFDQQFPGLLA